MKNWQELTGMIGEEAVIIQRVMLPERGVAIEGSFDLPPLAQLTMEDQVFVAAFVRSHGSIKQMEQLFGISYPTVKNRLNKVSEKLDFVDVSPLEDHTDILDQLERGEITAREAAEKIKK
jgi:hypothetical protein